MIHVFDYPKCDYCACFTTCSKDCIFTDSLRRHKLRCTSLRDLVKDILIRKINTLKKLQSNPQPLDQEACARPLCFNCCQITLNDRKNVPPAETFFRRWWSRVRWSPRCWICSGQRSARRDPKPEKSSFLALVEVVDSGAWSNWWVVQGSHPRKGLFGLIHSVKDKSERYVSSRRYVANGTASGQLKRFFQLWWILEFVKLHERRYPKGRISEWNGNCGEPFDPISCSTSLVYLGLR